MKLCKNQITSYFIFRFSKNNFKDKQLLSKKNYQFSQKTKSHIAEILVIAWYYKILRLCLFEIKKFKTGRLLIEVLKQNIEKKSIDCSLEMTFFCSEAIESLYRKMIKKSYDINAEHTL